MKRKKYRKILITIILMGLATSIPFIPYNSSEIIKDNTLDDKIMVDANDPTDLKILEGENKLNEFCLSNNKFAHISDLTGNNPIHKLTTYSQGIPQRYIFNLYGEFEITQDGGVGFYVNEWENVGEPCIYLSDTIYMRYYIPAMLLVILLGTTFIIDLLKKKD